MDVIVIMAVLLMVTILVGGSLAATADTTCATINSYPMSQCDATVYKGHSKWVTAIAVLSDGTFVSGSSDQTIKHWQLGNSNPLDAFNTPNLVQSLTALHDGSFISASSVNFDVSQWRIGSFNPVFTYTSSAALQRSVITLTDGSFVGITNSPNYAMQRWVPGNAAATDTFTGHSSFVSTLAALPDGTFLSGAQDNTIKRWRAGTSSPIATYTGHTGWLTAIAPLNDGSFVSSAQDMVIKRWWPRQSVAIETFTGHSDYPKCLLGLQDGSFISGALDHTMKRWIPGQSAAVETYNMGSPVSSLAALSDGSFLSGSWDTIIRRWYVDYSVSRIFKINYGYDLNYIACLNPSPHTSTSTTYTVSVDGPKLPPNGVVMYDSGTGTVSINGGITAWPLTTIYVTASSNGLSVVGSFVIGILGVNYPVINLILPRGQAMSSQLPIDVDTTGALTQITSAKISSGRLPAGLLLNDVTGVLSGTPSELYPISFVQVTFTTTSAEAVTDIWSWRITVTGVGYTASSYVFPLGIAIATLIPQGVGTDGALSTITKATLTSGTIPGGLFLDPTSGALSGTPTTVHAYTPVTVTLTTASGFTATTSIPLAVTGIAYPSLSFLLYVGIALPVQVPLVVDANGASASIVTATIATGALPLGLKLGVPGQPGGIAGVCSTEQEASVVELGLTSQAGKSVKVALTFTVKQLSIDYNSTTMNFILGNSILPMTPVVTPLLGADNFLVNPPLPSGLWISTASGVISGTPAALTTPTVYTIIATNIGGGRTVAVLTLQVTTPHSYTLMGTLESPKTWDPTNVDYDFTFVGLSGLKLSIFDVPPGQASPDTASSICPTASPPVGPHVFQIVRDRMSSPFDSCLSSSGINSCQLADSTHLGLCTVPTTTTTGGIGTSSNRLWLKSSILPGKAYQCDFEFRVFTPTSMAQVNTVCYLEKIASIEYPAISFTVGKQSVFAPIVRSQRNKASPSVDYFSLVADPSSSQGTVFPLPQGIIFDATTGVISGTAADKAASAVVFIQAVNNVDAPSFRSSVTKMVVIQVETPWSAWPVVGGVAGVGTVAALGGIALWKGGFLFAKAGQLTQALLPRNPIA